MKMTGILYHWSILHKLWVQSYNVVISSGSFTMYKELKILYNIIIIETLRTFTSTVEYSRTIYSKIIYMHVKLTCRQKYIYKTLPYNTIWPEYPVEAHLYHCLME